MKRKLLFGVTIVFLILSFIFRNVWFTHINFDRYGDKIPGYINIPLVQFFYDLDSWQLLAIKVASVVFFITLYFFTLSWMIRYFLGNRKDLILSAILYGFAISVAGLSIFLSKFFSLESFSEFGRHILVFFQSPIPVMILFFAFYLKRAENVK